MTKIVIFDWDGTLVDSTARIVDCVHKSAIKVGIPAVTDRQARHIIGLGLPEAIRTLWPEISDDDHQQMCLSYGQFFSQGSEIGVNFYPGILELLNELKQAGVMLAVATGKTRKGLNAMISDMAVEGVFDITRCADETCSKPNPQMLQEILQQQSLTAEQAIMIGDTTFDLEMAHRINIPSIAMLYGAHEKPMLEPWQPKVYCQDASELRRYLKRAIDF